MEAAHGCQALYHIGPLGGVGLGGNALITVAGGAGLAGINAGDDQQLVADLLLEGSKTGNILQHGVLPVRGAGTDDQEHPGVLSRKDVRDLFVPPGLGGHTLSRQRDGLLDLLGGGKLPEKLHIGQGVHGLILPFCFKSFSHYSTENLTMQRIYVIK